MDLPKVVERYVPRDWIFPLVLAIFVAVVVWFARALHDFLLPGPSTVMVPSFVGQTLPDAQTEIARLHLRGEVIGHAPSGTYPKGVVMSQQPFSGMSVRAGRQISLEVSDGLQSVPMPDLRYQSLRDAGVDLSRSRLALSKTIYKRSDDIPPGDVIDQDPAPLVSVTEGTPVTLTVSSGGAMQVKVPQFAGMSVDDARSLAASEHVKLGQIVWTPLGKNGPPHGTVVRQIPAPGTQLDPYSEVSLDVSAGPNQSGYLIHQAHVLVSVPIPEGVAPGTSLKVRITVTDATGTYDAYDAYAQPGQKLDFTLTTLGTSVVDMYVGPTLIGQARLGTEPPNAYGSPMPKSKR